MLYRSAATSKLKHIVFAVSKRDERASILTWMYQGKILLQARYVEMLLISVNFVLAQVFSVVSME